ncbi:mannosyltransferase, partial [Linderina pennispora]
SRLVALTLGIAANAIYDDYDTSVFLILPRASTHIQQLLRAVAQVVVRWDSFYFLHISESGYVFEQEHAFFPLLPGLMRLLDSTVLAPLHLVVDRQLSLTIAGLVVCNLAFVLAAVALYKLGCRTLKNESLAYIAALLFVLAPSNMFMSAIYTESLFAWLVFTAILRTTEQKHAEASLWLCLSSLCRSNGALYSGFIVWDMVVMSEAWSSKTLALPRRAAVIALQMVKALALVLISSLGFMAFQIYGYREFCMNGSVTPRRYCSSTLPLLYSFVQDEYWNVGFLRYYTVQQIPNFLLALPMAGLSAAGLWAYSRHDVSRILTLGWRSSQERKRSVRTHSLHMAYFGDDLLPHMYLWALLLCVATTTMHVQVITRFFSSVPPVFWFAAHLVSSGNRLVQRAVLTYFIGYGLVGVVLFSNFLPPA